MKKVKTTKQCAKTSPCKMPSCNIKTAKKISTNKKGY